MQYRDGQTLADAFGGPAGFVEALESAWRREVDEHGYEEEFLEPERIRKQAALARNARAAAYADLLDALVEFIEQNRATVESAHRARVDIEKARTALARAETWQLERITDLMRCTVSEGS